VNDKAFIGLMRKFLKAGVLKPDNTIEYPEQGTPQGSILSPVLANIYLHYVLDEWFYRKVKPTCKAEALMVRYADDFIAAFRLHAEAKRFYTMLKERLRKFSLEVAKEKTRILLFNRFRKEESKTFVFLGYEFRRIRTSKGLDTVTTVMHRKKLSRIVNEFSQWCKKHRNKRTAWIMGMVKAKLRGIRNYFSLPGNSKRNAEAELLFERTLYRWMNRRSERKSYNWKTFSQMWKYSFGRTRRQLANTGVQLSFITMLL
jgi:RNA-directed DNA polymerase